MSTESIDSFKLELLNVERISIASTEEEILFDTNHGRVKAIHHPANDTDLAIIWVFGAGGGLGGPAGGVYARLAYQLKEVNIASLRMDYRRPGELENCIMDVLMAIYYLKTLNYSRFILVGHSFGGAVVISAGVLSEEVIGVAALSSQTYGTNMVKKLTPRPLLLIHGTTDEILSPTCSANIFERAAQPKEIIYYRGCSHGLDECREDLDRDLTKWLNGIAKTDVFIKDRI